MTHKRIFILIGFMLAGCSFSAPEEKYSETRFLMGTLVHIDVCRRDIPEIRLRDAMDAAWERLEDIHWRMSVFDERSDVTKVNRSHPAVVEVKADTYRVIQDAVRITAATEGAFDITVGPLVELWKSAGRKGVLPDDAALAEAKAVTGAEHIRLLEGDRVKILDPGVRIDLGGIAKGYAIDEAARILREHAVGDFLIDAGGDLFVSGRNCEGDLWRIGIRDPRDTSRIIDVVALSDMAVVTSGNYEQNYEIEGKKLSHVIDPRTGYPQETVASATVVAPTAGEADAWATALTVLEPREGIALVDRGGGPLAALVIVPEGPGSLERHASREYQKLRLVNTETNSRK